MKAPDVKNTVKSACRVIKAIVKGDALLLDEASVKQRLAACEGTPGKTPPCPAFEPEARQCLDCTCLVDLKIQFVHERCPRHKWVSTNK
jgi:hypothetical protein